MSETPEEPPKEPLERYEEKRDFRRTPEPRGGAAAAEGGRAPVFVVHRHEARRLHYDLRLEVDGVLWSWAVPRGFSYETSKKRLAVRTEDHPLEYEEFHGMIPKGEYGGGTMTIWDRGTYELRYADSMPAARATGEIKVILRGRRLRGEWHLVETKGEERQWLLFKSRDRYSGPDRDSVLGVDLTRAPEAPLPKRLTRMRPAERVEPFSAPDWLFELDYAGQRVLAFRDGERCGLRGLRRRLPRALARRLPAARCGRLAGLPAPGRPGLAGDRR